MSKRKDELDRLQIASPCSTGWERMSGDERKRYCDECQRFVYDFSKMTRRQIEAMVAISQGRICARLTRQEDGSLLTLEIPPVAYPANRRALPVASVVMTAILSVNAAGLPQPLSILPQSSPVSARQEAGQDPKKDDARAQLGEATATLLGKALDPMGAVLPVAMVTLINESTKEERNTIAAAQGYRFPQLLPGTYTLKVGAPGFAAVEQNGIQVRAGQEQQVDVTMQVVVPVTLGGMVVIRTPPLRELYRESELVAVATVGNSFQTETEGRSNLMKTWLNLSSTLKGNPGASQIPLYHWAASDEPSEFAPGDKLLVFLNRRRSDEGKELLDGYKNDLGGYGVKKLSEEALKVYLRRIDELDSLLKREKPDQAEVLEWLVRCAEDPATRSEGMSELTKSMNQLCELGAKDECRMKEEEKATAKAALQLNQLSVAQADQDDQDDEDEDVKIASLLTKEQKERLLTVLYKTEEVKEGDQELIELAKDWQDARLVPFLLAQLRRVEAAPPRLAEDLIATIAEVLDDEKITALAEDYADKAEYDDLDEDDDDLSADERNVAAEAAATALADRRVMLQKFIFAAQSKVNLSSSVR